MSIINQPIDLEIVNRILAKWQEIVDLISELMDVPAPIIVRLEKTGKTSFVMVINIFLNLSRNCFRTIFLINQA